MTNDGWGSKWPVIPWQKPTKKIDRIGIDLPNVRDTSWPVAQIEKTTVIYNNPDWSPVKFTGHVVCDVDKDGNINLIPLKEKLKSQGSNLVDDQQYLYFQCDDCGDILDPHTKSFAKLQEHRVNAGWHVKWNIDGMGYKIYCAKCGEKV